MSNQEKMTGTPAKANNEQMMETNIPTLISREQNVKKCFIKSWELFTDETFMRSRKLKLVRTASAFLIGTAMMFGMKWSAKFYLNLQAMKLFMPEELTWKEKFLMLQTLELWLCLSLLIIGGAFCIYHKKIRQKMLTTLIEPTDTESATNGFGKKIQLGIILFICTMLVVIVTSMPVIYLQLSYYQNENAIAIGDTVAGIPTLDYSAALICTAFAYILLSLSMLNSIAWKILKAKE